MLRWVIKIGMEVRKWTEDLNLQTPVFVSTGSMLNKQFSCDPLEELKAVMRGANGSNDRTGKLLARKHMKKLN